MTEPFLAQGKKATPLDPVWRTAVRAEAAVGEGGFAATAAFDVAAFFESLDWSLLRRRAVEEGFPLPILRMALAMYAAPRHVGADGAVDGAWFPRRGIAPGCPWAMALAKLYVVGAFRRIAAQHQHAQLSVYVDDVVVAAEGQSAASVREIIVGAAADVLAAIPIDLHGQVAEEKSVIVASTEQLAQQIRKDLQLPGEVAAVSAVFLGGEVATGKPRKAWGGSAGRKVRQLKTKRRLHRVRAFRAAAGPQAARIARTGLVPAAAHAADIFGVSEAELLALQRMAAAAQTPSAQGRSLTALRLVRDDPAEEAAVAPLLRWCREVWEAANTVRRAFTMPQLRSMWTRALPGKVWQWRDCRGPMSAAVLSARRLGWKCRGPFVLSDRSGVRLSLTSMSPGLLKKLAMQDWQRATDVRLAARWKKGQWSWGDDDPNTLRLRPRNADGGFAVEGDGVPSPPSAAVIREALKGSKLTAAEKGALAAVATNAVWPRQRLAEARLASSGLCTLCGEDLDTVHHRAWSCPASLAIRGELATPAQVARARAAGTESPVATVERRMATQTPQTAAAPKRSEHDGLVARAR